MKKKNLIIITCIIGIIILIVTFLKLKATKFVFYWDTTIFYDSAIQIKNVLIKNPIYTIINILKTMFYFDYNYLPAIIPAIFMSIFGENRISFTLATTVIFYIPFIFLFLNLIEPAFKDMKNKNFYLVVSTLTCLPILSYLNYMGYVDIAGLDIILAIYYLIRKKSDNNLKKNMLIGFLLILLYFFRRWYAYFSVSFLITLLIFDIYKIVKCRREKDEIKKICVEYLEIIFGILIVIFATIVLNALLFYEGANSPYNWKNFYLIKVLLSNYSEDYAGYKNSFAKDLAIIGNFIGYIIIALTIISIIISIRNKKKIKEVTFLTIQMLLCYAIFERTQSGDIHHYLLYVINIMIIVSIELANTNNKILRRVMAGILIFNFIISEPFCYNIGLVKFLKKYYIVNNIDLKVAIRDDMDELEKICVRLAELSENGEKNIYVNSSSAILNRSIIRNYEIQDENAYKSKEYILDVSDIDSRDGVPEKIKIADYILVTSPTQTHRGIENQKIVDYINKMFLSEEFKNEFSKKFELEENLKLGDIDIYIYKKIKETDDDDYNNLKIEAEKYINVVQF